MIKKAYIIDPDNSSELHQAAHKYWLLYNADTSFWFNKEQRLREHEANLNLAETEFWKLMREYVGHAFREELKGDWHLCKHPKIAVFQIEQDSPYVF